MSKTNWPFQTDLSHPNFTGMTKRESSGYAPGTEKPKCGWLVAGALGLLFCYAVFYGPTLLLRWLG